jgi:hypothetical protein
MRLQPASANSRTHKAYSISAPLDTHWRKGTCEEADCKYFREGWTYDVRQLDAELLRAIELAQPRRRYRKVQHLGVEYWVFYPGQPCFAGHKVRIERPENFYVTPNSERLVIPRARRHANWDDWQDDFANHQEKIKEERGQ